MLLSGVPDESVGVGVGSVTGVGVGSGVGDGVADGVGEGVGSGVGEGVDSGVGDGAGEGVGAWVGSGVGATVGCGVGAAVGVGVATTSEEATLSLAALLEDGMQLYVPSREEAAGSGAGADEASRKGVGAPDVSGEYFSGSGFPESTGDTEEAPVNINTAGAQELMTLSGIGESRAEAILSYREENGAFSSIDEIKNVSGIGEGIFEKIKNMITV